MSDAPRTATLPLFPLNTVLFPGGPLQLRIFETRYVDMVRDCMRRQTGFGVVQIRQGREAGGPVSTAPVGTRAGIVDFNVLPDGLLGISCRGESRFRLLERWKQQDGLNVGVVEWLPEPAPVPLPPLHLPLASLLRRVLPELGASYEGIEPQLDDAGWVGARLAEILPLDPQDRQRLLEIDDPVERLAQIAPYLRREADA